MAIKCTPYNCCSHSWNKTADPNRHVTSPGTAVINVLISFLSFQWKSYEKTTYFKDNDSQLYNLGTVSSVLVWYVDYSLYASNNEQLIVRYVIFQGHVF
jgi:hypothetical protein